MSIFWFFWRVSFGTRKKRLAAHGSRLGLAGSQNSLPPEQQQAPVYANFHGTVFVTHVPPRILLHNVFLTSLWHRARMISVIINDASVFLFIQVFFPVETFIYHLPCLTVHTYYGTRSLNQRDPDVNRCESTWKTIKKENRTEQGDSGWGQSDFSWKMINMVSKIVELKYFEPWCSYLFFSS